MINEIIKIRNYYLNNLHKDLTGFSDVLYEMSLPKEVDSSYYPAIYNHKNYNEGVCKYKIEKYHEVLKIAVKKADEISDASEKAEGVDTLLVHPFYVIFRHLNLCMKQ